MDWSAAWPNYQQALDWWAGQRDIERARDRYLKIIFKAAHPPRRDDNYFYTYYGNFIPLDVLENALKLSRSPNETAHINYLIAMTMRQTGSDFETLDNACRIILRMRSQPASKLTGTTTPSFTTRNG